MIAILSPAMNMDAGDKIKLAGADLATSKLAITEPIFQADAKMLADTLQSFGPLELTGLLSTNPDIALRAYEDYCDFAKGGEPTPALLAFRGLAFQNLDPESFSAEELAFAQEHLCILSALYGILRSLDGIFPYRLDFMCRFAKGKEWGKRLYDFWGQRVYDELFKMDDTVVNLCSAEYAKLIKPYLPSEGTRGLAQDRARSFAGNTRWITCHFLESSQGRYVCRATASKMARGQMARFIIKERIDDPDDLKAFEWGGYRFSPAQSHAKLFVFTR